MELPSILHSLVQSLRSRPGTSSTSAHIPAQQTVSLAPLTGQTLSAVINKITAPTTEQRSWLIQHFVQTPGSKLSNTHQLKELLHSKHLALVTLKIGQLKQVVFTEQKLSKGQSVKVSVGQDGNLTLLPPAKNNTPSQNQNAPLQSTAKNADSFNNRSLSNRSLNNAVGQNTAQSRVIQEHLRRVIPQGQRLQNLFQSVLDLQAPLSQGGSDNILPSSVAQALRTMAQHLRTPQQLSQPKQLRQILQNSGFQLENRLYKLANPSASGRTQVTESVNQVMGTDLKAALLKLLASVVPHLPSSGLNYDSKAQGPLSESAQAQRLNLLHNSGAKGDDSVQASRQKLLHLIHQQVSGALAKLQLQQLQSLSRQYIGVEGKALPNAWQFEIPFRNGSELGSLDLYIEEQALERPRIQEREPQDEQPSNRDDPKTTNQHLKQWDVKLSLDLSKPLGQLHSQLTVVENSVSLTLWFEQSRTYKKALSALEDLRQHLQDKGIRVERLECFEGCPPEATTKLGYSLVDVRT